MSASELERLNEQGLSAWDKHDPEGFVAMFADDFAWYDWSMPEPIRDRDAAKEYFGEWMRAFPDMRTTSANTVVGQDAVAAEIEWEGTNTGPMMMAGKEIPPTNKKVVGRGSYIAKVKDGKVVEFRSHPDIAGMMMQLGFMPAM